MNSLPIIEGLTYTYSSEDVKNLYDHVVSDFKDFLISYQAYTKCGSSTQCNTDDVQSKLSKVNESLAQFNDAVEQHKSGTDKDTIQLQQHLKMLRSEVDERAKIIVDARNSVNEDYIIKQQSQYYYNMMISVFLAILLYFTFYRIDNK